MYCKKEMFEVIWTMILNYCFAVFMNTKVHSMVYNGV